MDEVEQFLARALSGSPTPWTLDEEQTARLLAASTRHGLDGLMHQIALSNAWPEAVRQSLRASVMAWALWDEQHRVALGSAIEALAAANVKSLLFKGAATAYSIYPSAHLRPRSDSDLLIRPEDRHRVAEILASQGWELMSSIDCEHLSYECSFVRQHGGMKHLLDVHWRIHYSQFQTRALDWAHLRPAAIPVPAISTQALAVSPAHNFAITCFHRANDMHLPQWTAKGPILSGDRWIALYDIHLILSRLQPSEREGLADEAIRCHMAGVCAHAVAAASELYGTGQLAGVDRLHARLSAFTHDDAPSTYRDLSTPRQRWRDLNSLESARDRAAWLREHLFPPASYMHAQYPDHRDPLPLLQLRRVMRACRRWSTRRTDTLSST